MDELGELGIKGGRLKSFWVLQELYRQQEIMNREKTEKIIDTLWEKRSNNKYEKEKQQQKIGLHDWTKTLTEDQDHKNTTKRKQKKSTTI